MEPTVSQTHDAHELLEKNRRFYDALWSDARLVEPQRFNTWPVVQSLLPESGLQLEVAPGLRPRLPVDGTRFVDISEPALAKLSERNAQVIRAQINHLPFPDASFDLVCAFDIVEHVDDEDGAFSELSRVMRPGAALLLSIPLHPSMWTTFDDFVGHKRRYEPARLSAKLTEHHLVIERSAAYGMKPRSSRLVDFGMWWLLNQRERAMPWYNRVIMPLGLRFQKELRFAAGMIPTDDVNEILLVCRSDKRAA